MSTPKHDAMMARPVPLTVGELAELAAEANRLQADVVGQADAARLYAERLSTSNDARHVLVGELHKLDDELTNERGAFAAMEQTAITLRGQLDVERAKHQRATAHIAAMVRGTGWPLGRPNVWQDTYRGLVAEVEQHKAHLTSEAQAFRAQHEEVTQALRNELDRTRESLAESRAALGIVPLRFAVGDRVTLAAAHNDGVVGDTYTIVEANAGGSLPYYLGDECQWVPEVAVEAAPAEPEPRPFEVGNRVRHATKGLGVVIEDDGAPLSEMPYLVKYDDSTWNNSQGGWFTPTNELQAAPWEPGEGIQVGVEVEYVGGGQVMASSKIGRTGSVTSVHNTWARAEGIPGTAMLYNLRRIS